MPDFVRQKPDLGRVVWLYSVYCHETEQWSAFIPKGDGDLITMHPLGMLSGAYVSSAPEREDDFANPLSTLFFQHLSFPDLIDVLDGINEDLINSLSLVHNYFILVDHANNYGGFAAQRVITTVIEAMLTTHRSFYDLLNRIVTKMVRHTGLQGADIPDSFRRVTQKSEDDLRVKYHLPEPLALFYKQREARFMTLRDVRDSIVHGGQSPQLIYNYSAGFGIGLNSTLVDSLLELGIWREDTLEKNHIGSVLSLLTYLVIDMFGVLQELASAVRQSFAQLPAAISPGLTVFNRSELMFHRTKAAGYMDVPWQNPVPLLKIPAVQQEDGQGR